MAPFFLVAWFLPFITTFQNGQKRHKKPLLVFTKNITTLVQKVGKYLAKDVFAF